MRRYLVVLSVLVVMWVVAVALWAGTPGIFRGVVILGPDHEPGWIMVAGAKGQLRHVAIGSAQVVYADSVPAKDRQKKPELAIVHGAEIRVTADQDGHGEWRAQKIEILKLKAELPIQPSARSGDIRST